MAQQNIGIGAAPNDGTGDPIRDAFDKANDNFTELYAGLVGLLDLKGDQDCSANPNYPAALKGDLYIATVAGKIGGAAGAVVQAGDSFFAKADNAGGTQAAVGASWAVIQANLVVDNDTSLAGDSTTNVPSQHAVKAYVDAQVGGIGGYTDEMARDAIGTALTDTGLALVTVNDGGDTIDINVPAASSADINGGSDAAKALTADALAGSNFGKAVVTILVTDPAGAALTVGDGKAYFPVPSTLDGMNLVGVKAFLVGAVSSAGIPAVQIANVTDGVDMLSTKLTIDASEATSATAATAAVIDALHDDVATGDILRLDCDVAGTGAKGLIVEMQFQLP